MKKSNKVLLIIVAVILFIGAMQVLAASRYKMQVNVVEGENIMGLNPTTESLDFGDLARNNGMTRYITLNGGRISAYIIVWQYGEASELVDVSDSRFALDPGEEKRIAFHMNIPPSAETKEYKGGVVVFKLPKIF